MHRETPSRTEVDHPGWSAMNQRQSGAMLALETEELRGPFSCDATATA